MNFITSGANMPTNQNHYSQIPTISSMKMKLRMFTKILGRINKCLNIEIIRLSQNIAILVACKMEDEMCGVKNLLV